MGREALTVAVLATDAIDQMDAAIEDHSPVIRSDEAMTEPTTSRAIGALLAAIEQTSSDMTAMNERILSLEAANYRLEEENSQLRADLSEAIRDAEAAQASAEAAARGADLAEANVAAHRRHADQLQVDLQATIGDLSQIATAVSDLPTRTAA